MGGSIGSTRRGSPAPVEAISRMDQGIGRGRDDFFESITPGTNVPYGRSTDFVNTWGSAAVRVS